MGTQTSAGKATDEQPQLVVIAGPNGAGKSTSAPRILRGPLKVNTFVNADVIARGLSAFSPESVSLSAGRIMLNWLKELATERQSFAFETTLASRSFAPWIKELIQGGYDFHLVYLWIDSKEAAVDRVKSRVRSGGHMVPDEVVHRRYQSGIENFFQLYMPLTTSWRMVYNGVARPTIIAVGSGEDVIEVKQPRRWQQIQATSNETRR